MSEALEKMKMDMELKGYSKGTQKEYLLRAELFEKHFGKPTEMLGYNEIKAYLYYIIKEKNLSNSTVNVIYSAIRFLCETTLDMRWDLKKIPRMKKEKPLPSVLSPKEIKSLFETTENLKYKTILMTIYSAGLRVSEAANLKVTDIDSKNMQILVRQGKGKKDRYTLLSKETLIILREYWKKYRPKDWLFTGRSAQQPISVKMIQHIFKEAKNQAKINKPASVHTLRHSFATHLLDNGTNIFYIKQLLAHNHISSTSRYLHLMSMDVLKVVSPLDLLVGGTHD